MSNIMIQRDSAAVQSTQGHMGRACCCRHDIEPRQVHAGVCSFVLVFFDIIFSLYINNDDYVT